MFTYEQRSTRFFSSSRHGTNQPSSGQMQAHSGEKNRLETAVDLAIHINLRKNRPSLLIGPAATSGLVPQSKPLEVYKAQSLAFESLDGNRFL